MSLPLTNFMNKLVPVAKTVGTLIGSSFIGAFIISEIVNSVQSNHYSDVTGCKNGVLLIGKNELGDLERNALADNVGTFKVHAGDYLLGPPLYSNARGRAYSDVCKQAEEIGANVAEIDSLDFSLHPLQTQFPLLGVNDDLVFDRFDASGQFYYVRTEDEL